MQYFKRRKDVYEIVVRRKKLKVLATYLTDVFQKDCILKMELRFYKGSRFTVRVYRFFGKKIYKESEKIFNNDSCCAIYSL